MGVCMTSPTKDKRLVLIGDSAFAEVAFENFERLSGYTVVAFAVEAAHRARDTLFDRPVVDLETLHESHPPDRHDVYVAIVYSQLNRLRARLAATAKSAGYHLASFVSPGAHVWPNVKLGEHCFIFENNVVQPFVSIGSNVVLWSGNHIGHHSTIRDNVFVSSHVVVSGFCDIGANCFLGVNASIANNVTIGADCWIGPGVAIARDVPTDQIARPAKVEFGKVTASRYFGLEPNPL